MDRQARANVKGIRQRTQYTCMSTSMCMALKALGYDVDEDDVNRVMGAQPMRGAAWEQALACAQHFGVRATLTVPSTIRQLKNWTDEGNPVMIAWNPEGRDWSHASLVFDVTERPETLGEHEQIIGSGPGLYVHVADPNLPHPDKTVRIVHEDEFYARWSEKWPNYLVRRPACCLEREITHEGRQVMASVSEDNMADRKARQSKKPQSEKDKLKTPEAPKRRNEVVKEMVTRGWGSGKHQNKGQRGQGSKGQGKGQRHPKHKGRKYDASAEDIAARWIAEQESTLHVRLANRWLEACGPDGECQCGGTCGGCGGKESEKETRPEGLTPEEHIAWLEEHSD